MDKANIVIVGVHLAPSVVETGQKFTIEAEISDKVYGILTADDELILAADGRAIEHIEPQDYLLQTADGENLTDADGNSILI